MSFEADKAKGDEAFRAGRHQEAVTHYTAALEAAPRNTTLLNNRSAAYHCLGKFENALDDANKSTGIESTARGYQRVGNAYWGLRRYDQAVMAYERSLELAPSPQVRNDLAQVKQLDEQQQAGAAAAARQNAAQFGAGGASALRGLHADVAVIVFAFLHIILMIVSYATSLTVWKLAVGAFAYRQVLILTGPGGPGLTLSREALAQLTTHFSFQYILLCAFMIFTGAPPQLLLLMAMAIYVVGDIYNNRALFNSTAPYAGVAGIVGPYLDKYGAQRDQLKAQAAMSEVMTGVMFPLSGGGMMGMMIYWQFLKFRYNNDSLMKLAFQAVAEGAGKVFYHPRCPAAIGDLFTKFRALLHRLATGQ